MLASRGACPLSRYLCREHDHHRRRRRCRLLLPASSISPAFEWAQSGDWVYINAKMSHKLDAPATLNVASEAVDIRPRSLKFSATKDQKRFALDLALHAEVDPEVRLGKPPLSSPREVGLEKDLPLKIGEPSRP